MWTEIKRTVTSTSSLPCMSELRDAHCRSFVVNALVEYEILRLRLKKISINNTKCNILIYCYQTTNECVEEVAVFLLMHFWIYSNMFRQIIAIIRGLWFPQKLLKRFVLWMYMDYRPSRLVSCRGM
jgi:hypothetical protein